MLYHATLVAALLAPCTQEESQGILAQARIAPTAAIVPLRPILADLDGDQDLDLAIANGFLQLQPPLLEVQLLDADGRLERLANLSSPQSNPFAMPRYAVAHDFDGDRLPELVVAYSDGHIDLFPNAGGGAFLTPLRFTPGFVGSATGAVSYAALCHAVTDLDRDGRPELVLPFLEQQLFFPRRGAGLVILEHDGGSGYLLTLTSALGGTSAALAGGDLDGDGNGDLASVDGSGQLTIARGDGRGGFALVTQQLLDPLGVRADELALGDLDRDGDLDLVVGYGASPHLELLENRGGLVFASRLLTLASDPRVAVRGVAQRDLDGDGALELIVLEAGHPGDRGRLCVWRRQLGSYALDASVDAGILTPGSDIGPEVLAIGDLDGNATPDIAVAGYRAAPSGAPQIGLFANLSTPPYQVAWSGLGSEGSNGRVPSIGCGGGPAVLGNPGFWVEVRDGLPAGRATIFLGSEPTVNYAAGGVALLLVPLYLEVAHLDHSGAHRWSIPIGNDPALVGEWGYAQVWIGDPWAPNPALLAATRRLGVRVGERW